MNKRKLATVLIAFLAVSVWAQTKPAQPKRSEAVLIAKVRIQPAIDEGFFLGYVKVDKRKPPMTKAYLELFSPGSIMGSRHEEIGPLNAFGYPRFAIPKDRIIVLRSLRVNILDSGSLYIRLPFNVSFSVPEDSPFVYLGTFVLRYADEYFTPVSFERIDEFDEALAELRAALGPQVKLNRAVFTEYQP